MKPKKPTFSRREYGLIYVGLWKLIDGGTESKAAIKKLWAKLEKMERGGK